MQASELEDMENRDPNNVNDHLKVLRIGFSCFCLVGMCGFVVVAAFLFVGFCFVVVVLFVLSLFVLLGEGGMYVLLPLQISVLLAVVFIADVVVCLFCFVFLMSFDIVLV